MLVFYALSMLVLNAPVIDRQLTGTATSVQGVPTYTLEQRESWSKKAWTHREVIGRRSDGRVLFRQTITPGTFPSVPNIKMTYEGSPKMFSVAWEGSQVKLSFVSAAGKRIRNTLVSPPDNLVGPGGILAAIRKEWPRLRRGTTLNWTMIVPPKANAYAVRLVPGGLETINGVKALKLTLEADSWFVRVFAPSTLFWIDLEHRSTLRYQGLGARDGPDGDPIETILEFQPDALPLVAPQL